MVVAFVLVLAAITRALVLLGTVPSVVVAMSACTVLSLLTAKKSQMPATCKLAR